MRTDWEEWVIREASRGEGGEHGEAVPEDKTSPGRRLRFFSFCCRCAIASVWDSSIASSFGTDVGVRGITNTGDNALRVDEASGR